LRAIPERLDSAPGTISRELSCNAGRGSYRPEAAKRLFERRGQLARRSPRIHIDCIDRIKALLEADSP